MTTKPHDWVWLDQRETVSLSDLSRACGMSSHEVEELMEYGALASLPSPSLPSVPTELHFSAEYVMPLRTAGKMRLDYDLDIFTVVLLMDGLHRIEMLERQLRKLEVLLPRSDSLLRSDETGVGQAMDR